MPGPPTRQQARAGEFGPSPRVHPVVLPVATRPRDLASRVRDLGRVATEDALRRLDAAQPAAGRVARAALARAPGEITRLARDVVLEVAQAQARAGRDLSPAEKAALPGIARVAALATHDVRSTREAAEALGALAEALDRAPAIRDLVNRALGVLEERGVLGSKTLGMIVALLGAIGTRVVQDVAAWTRGDAVTVQVGRQSFTLDKAGTYAASLRVNPGHWSKDAVEIVLQGTREAPAGSRDTGIRATRAQVVVPVDVTRSSFTTPVITLRPGGGLVPGPGGSSRARVELGARIATPAERRAGVTAAIEPRLAVEGGGMTRAVEGTLAGHVTLPAGSGGRTVTLSPYASGTWATGQAPRADAGVQVTGRFGGEPADPPARPGTRPGARPPALPPARPPASIQEAREPGSREPGGSPPGSPGPAGSAEDAGWALGLSALFAGCSFLR